ncbi:MAG: hypothetical protein IT518_17535 [Burkholderiales bacterium]|nr:hypothetical protein [Burkholderiales bacterium]
MTSRARILSVRLQTSVADALDRYCDATGMSRTRVVHQSVAQDLVERTAPSLGALAEAVLPAPRDGSSRPLASRQQRYRDRVREKRRR